jgi:sugar phosphate isomerase/epimerase
VVLERKVSRRQLLKAGAATAAAASMLPMAGATVFAAPSGGNGRLIPTGKVGTITYTQRDVPGRPGIASGNPFMGYLGGPGFPEDPNDLGPLVPLPGGWAELLQYLAGAGFHQIEFAGYGQNAANPGGAAPNPAPGGVTTAESRAAYLAYGRTLRGFLDDAGLEAIGNHGFIPNTWPGPSSAGGAMSTNDYERFQTELEFASILGMPYMGTGGDPTSANNRNIEPWTVAGEKWEALNELGAAWGIHIYPHNHSPAYNFLQDGPQVLQTVDRVTGAPLATPVMIRGESGQRLMEYYLEITDPELCVIELDVYWAHVAQHQHRWYFDWDGNRVEKILDPVALVAGQTQRFALYHAKDGDSTGEPVGVGNGYNFVPFGTGDIDFATFLKNQGARGYHNPNYEQDNAPDQQSATNPNPDRGRSLRFSTISGANMNGLRG